MISLEAEFLLGARSADGDYMLRFLLTFLLVSSASVGSEVVPTYSVSDADIGLMSCSNLHPPTEKQMRTYLEVRMDPDVTTSTTWHGVRFQDENPYLIELFQIAHRPEYSFIKPSIPATPCSKVICMMRQLYGERESLRMLYIAAKFGLRTSRFGMTAPDNYQNWAISELDDALVALDSLPPQLLPLKNHHLLRFADGYTLERYGSALVIANARMDIFDIWKTRTREDRISTIIHELGHILGTGHDTSSEWKSMPPTRLSAYAQKNAAEDFAESFLAYRVAPLRLKRLHPERYNFIKDRIFSGLEFKVHRDCEAPFLAAQHQDAKILESRREFASWTKTNRELLAAEIERQSHLGAFRKDLWKQCSATYFDEVLAGSRESTQNCIANLIRSRGFQVALRTLERERVVDSKRLPPGLHDFKVSPAALQLSRQELRQLANSLLQKIYNDKSFSEDLDNYLKLLPYYPKFKDDFNQNPGAISKLLRLAKEREQTQNWFQRLWGPDFLRLLP